MPLFKMFSNGNERELKKLQPIVDEINGLEAEMQALSDDELRAMTAEFRERLNAEDDPETLATLQKLGYAEPSRVAAMVRAWHHGRIRATRSQRQ